MNRNSSFFSVYFTIFNSDFFSVHILTIKYRQRNRLHIPLFSLSYLSCPKKSSAEELEDDLFHRVLFDSTRKWTRMQQDKSTI